MENFLVKLRGRGQKGHASTYSARYFKECIPKYEIPEKGMPANAAYQLIHDELNLDANPALNLSSFVTTWMEPEVEKAPPIQGKRQHHHC